MWVSRSRSCFAVSCQVLKLTLSGYKKICQVCVAYHADFGTWAVGESRILHRKSNSTTSSVTPTSHEPSGNFPGTFDWWKNKKKNSILMKMLGSAKSICVFRVRASQILRICSVGALCVVSCRPSISLWNHVSRPFPCGIHRGRLDEVTKIYIPQLFQKKISKNIFKNFVNFHNFSWFSPILADGSTSARIPGPI